MMIHAAPLVLLAAQQPEDWADRELPGTAGLELWFDATRLKLADNEAVKTWPDASGHKRDLTATGHPRFKTQGGVSVVRFDGRESRITGKGPEAPFAKFTVILVGAAHSNAGGYRALLSTNAPGKNDYLTGVNIDLGGRGQDTFATVNVEGASFQGERNLLAKAAPMGSFHVVSLTASLGGPGTVRLHADGEFSGHAGRGDAPASFAEFRLGARHYSNTAAPTSDSGFLHGDLAEVLVYSQALPEKELRAVEAYLKKKYPSLLKGEVLAYEAPPPVQMVVPGFTVKKLPVTLTNINTLEYAPDGRLFALGYDGRLHVLVDTDGDGLEDTVQPYWYKNEGDFRGPIGLVIAKEGVYVASKGKVSLIRDTDGDGVPDVCETVASGWTEIPQGVDTIGLALAKDGSLYFGLGCANYANAYLVDKEGKGHYDIKSERGTVLRVSPDRKSREIVCTGVRFTIGMAFNRHGDLFATDQEGETWLPGGNPLDELLQILPGRHYGFPPRHAKHLPGAIDDPAIVQFGPQHQSTCGLKFNEATESRKSFGPAAWEGDAIVVGESRGKLWRVPLVKTPAGYVGKPFLIGCQRMLSIDSAISPKGDLVLTCHSGLPDWGTGPKGEGALFKIVHTDRQAPQPVIAWPSGPLEVKVAFDRPVDAIKDATIVFGEFVSAADRREVLHPPYKVVDEQKRCPRATLKVAAIRLSDDRRTVTLTTASHPWLATYALTLGEIDLAYTLQGVEASWTAEGKQEPAWSGWLPHPDFDVVRGFTKGSAEHEAFLAVLEKPGWLTLRTQLAPSPEMQSIRFESEGAITLNGITSEKKASVVVKPGKDPLALTIGVPTGGKGTSLHTACSTDLNPHEFPLRLEQLLVPWAPSHRPPRPVEAAAASPLGPGGDWARGKALFTGEAKCVLCHSIRGEGGKAAPDLTNLIHWEPARILREILEPSATINPDYVNHLLELKNGDRLSGVVFPEGPDKIRLVNAEAKETILDRSAIKELRVSAISLMPDGYKALGDDKLRDLLAFLMQEKQAGPPARSRAEVEKALNLATDTGPGKPRAIRIALVTGPKDHGPGEHDYPACVAKWKDLVAKQAGVTLTTAFKEPSKEDWEKADLMVFFFMDGKSWNDDRYANLDAYLARGGGLALLHSACIPDKEPLKLAERIGLSWEPGKTKYRHGALDLKPAEHALTRGIGELHLEDETYWPLVGDLSKVEVLATAVEDGKPQPMIWTRKHEKGRVWGTLLGHYTWTFDDPLVRLLIVRGFAWAAGEPVDRFKPLVTDGVTLRD
jgi:putative heme-binding domain-containing protein